MHHFGLFILNETALANGKIFQLNISYLSCVLVASAFQVELLLSVKSDSQPERGLVLITGAESLSFFGGC